MKKVLPVVFPRLFLILILTTAVASANDGKDDKRASPAKGASAFAHKNLSPQTGNSKTSGEKSWWSNVWEGIGDLFHPNDDKDHQTNGVHHDLRETSDPESSTAPGGSTAPGSPAVPI